MAALRSHLFSLIKKIPHRPFFFTPYSTKKTDDGEDFDKPITYSTSKAAKWTAEASFRGTEKEDVQPDYQPIVIILSVTAFMVYFAILREENDLDRELEVPLFERVPGLEEVQLRNYIKYLKQKNRSTEVHERRLEEVVREREAREAMQA